LLKLHITKNFRQFGLKKIEKLHLRHQARLSVSALGIGNVICNSDETKM